MTFMPEDDDTEERRREALAYIAEAFDLQAARMENAADHTLVGTVRFKVCMASAAEAKHIAEQYRAMVEREGLTTSRWMKPTMGASSKQALSESILDDVCRDHARELFDTLDELANGLGDIVGGAIPDSLVVSHVRALNLVTTILREAR